jgi:hypothetical protein
MALTQGLTRTWTSGAEHPTFNQQERSSIMKQSTSCLHPARLLNADIASGANSGSPGNFRNAMETKA